MQRLTASNIISFINQLDTSISYNYLNPKNSGLIKIEHVQIPEGPIRIKRWNPSKQETEIDAESNTISSQQIWRIANALFPDQPINFDRVLGASYNTRSVFEALLAHTPQFKYCYPGRIDINSSKSVIKNGHKHLMWSPNSPHKNGITMQGNSDIVISEVPTLQVFYESLALPSDVKVEKLDIDTQRRHAQIQIALYSIGHQLNYKTWIAQNDKGITYQNKRIGDFDGIVPSLKDQTLIKSYPNAVLAGLLIDCIWFRGDKSMPAVMEIEHSTGVTSGLTRMKNFKDNLPEFPSRYVIVASDKERDKVIREANKSQFKDLDVRFFPYSSVEELYAICNKRKLKGINDEFLDCYMERILTN